jgi:hypothetical protein
MKNVRLMFLLLLMVNCTTDSPEIQERPDDLNYQVLNCIDDLPQLKITNNGTDNFDFAIYGQDYSQLYSQALSTSENTGWLEVSNYEVIVVATNDVVYGQKLELTLVPCDAMEIEIDVNNGLILVGI